MSLEQDGEVLRPRPPAVTAAERRAMAAQLAAQAAVLAGMEGGFVAVPLPPLVASGAETVTATGEPAV